MRTDPSPETEAELVVTATEQTDLSTLADRLTDAGVIVEDRLRFGALRVRVAETDVAALCNHDGIASIETAATRDVAVGDAGEDR